MDRRLWSARAVVLVGLVLAAACAPSAKSADSPDSAGAVGWGYQTRSSVARGTAERSAADVADVDATDTLSGASLAAAVGDPTTVSAGGTHACELITGGAVKCWGRNNYGQLGNKTTTNSNTPLTVLGLSGVTKLSAGYTHTCAIVAGGAVKCWGANTFGQLGNNTLTNSKSPVAVGGVTGATAISAGYYHSCAIVSGGAVKCWGQNKSGQLGNNSIVNAKTAVAVVGITGATKLSATGVGHTCAVVAGGAVRCWGSNTYGQLGNNTKVSSRVPVAVSGVSGASALTAGGYHSCVIVAGAAKCWGNNTYGQLGTGTNSPTVKAASVGGLTGATQISSFYRHTCAVVAGGVVKCWGYNVFGQLGVGNATNTNSPVSMSAVSGSTVLTVGANFTCVMIASPAIKCAGQNSFGQVGNATFATATTPVAVVATAGATDLAVGESHVCAIVTGGAVKCWGSNVVGELGNGTTNDSSTPVNVIGVTGATVLRVGFSLDGPFTCAIVTGGAVKCWGSNTVGQLGNGTTNDSSTPTIVSGVSGAVDVAIGASAFGPTTCALLSSGSVKCWGYGDSGQLGSGTNSSSSTATFVSGITDASVLLGATAQFGARSCAIVTGGAVKCWGQNDSGQLGDGTTVDAPTPVTVTGVTGATSLVAGGEAFTCALVAGGAAKCWGANLAGALGNGTMTNSSTAVDVTGLTGAIRLVSGYAIGYDGSVCALMADGTAKCWGANDYAQLGNGTGDHSSVPLTVGGVSSGTAIFGDGASTCVVVAGGVVKCWGYGPLGDGNEYGSLTAATIPGLSGATVIRTNDFASWGGCAIVAGGAVKCWGYASYGELGNGTTEAEALSPVTVLGVT